MADSRIDELRRRLERDPGSRLFAQLAEEYRKAGNHADAIRIARNGLAQHPSYPSARLTLGRALLDYGDAAGARAELEAALREAPDNILASRFLGQALEALGELAPALVQLEKTLKMAPGDRQLESQIVALQTRLRSRPAPAAPAPPPRPPAAASAPELPETSPSFWDVTAPMPSAEPPAAEAEPPPPTIRIRPPGESGAWARKAAVPPPLLPTAAPPPLPPTAAPAAATPTGPPPLPSAPPPLAVTERLPASALVDYQSDLAPTLPAVHAPELVFVDETAVPTLPPGAMATEETVFEPEPPPEEEPAPPPPTMARDVRRPEASPVVATRPPLEEAAPPERPAAGEQGGAATTPFSSSTLAELYLKQGLADRAAEVYRQLLVEEPSNERARSRLAEIERTPSADGARAARRRAIERTIAGLEALLAAVQRR